MLQLVDGGRSNRQIAERLCLAESTVRFHVPNLLTKLSAGWPQFVDAARQRGLL